MRSRGQVWQDGLVQVVLALGLVECWYRAFFHDQVAFFFIGAALAWCLVLFRIEDNATDRELLLEEDQPCAGVCEETV